MSSYHQNQKSGAGVAFGAAAFLIWGLSPAYWKMLKSVPALEIIAHRIVWSFVFLLPLILIQGRWREFTRTFKDGRSLLVLFFTALLVAANWLIYIWAVNDGHVLQASLGYYINPLISVLLGMIFLKEKLRRAQIIAVMLAGLGVLWLTLSYGKFPWISLSLAISFGFYGLIRKSTSVGALVGLSVETLLLCVPAGIYLIFINYHGNGAFFHQNLKIDGFLVGSALVTALPLLLFALGARRLHLSTIGFLQYIAPTGMFFLGVFIFGEIFSQSQFITFCIIWTALAIYSADSMSFYRKGIKIQEIRA